MAQNDCGKDHSTYGLQERDDACIPGSDIRKDSTVVKCQTRKASWEEDQRRIEQMQVVQQYSKDMAAE